MTRPITEFFLRRFWSRIEWSPLLWAGAMLFLLISAQGLGSSRAIAGGTGMGILAACFAACWRWADRYVTRERVLRSVQAGLYAALWIAGMVIGRWVSFQPAGWPEVLISVSVGAAVLGPLIYFMDEPGAGK